MPKHEIHMTKKSKNYALLLVIVAMMVLFFSVTVVKLQANLKHVPAQQEQ